MQHNLPTTSNSQPLWNQWRCYLMSIWGRHLPKSITNQTTVSPNLQPSVNILLSLNCNQQVVNNFYLIHTRVQRYFIFLDILRKHLKNSMNNVFYETNFILSAFYKLSDKIRFIKRLSATQITDSPIGVNMPFGANKPVYNCFINSNQLMSACFASCPSQLTPHYF